MGIRTRLCSGRQTRTYRSARDVFLKPKARLAAEPRHDGPHGLARSPCLVRDTLDVACCAWIALVKAFAADQKKISDSKKSCNCSSLDVLAATRERKPHEPPGARNLLMTSGVIEGWKRPEKTFDRSGLSLVRSHQFTVGQNDSLHRRLQFGLRTAGG